MKRPQIDIGSAVSSWVDGRFLMRSGYYAGRGPKECDLNSKILEMFYTGLKKDVGAAAATNFVRFVNKLHDLSATSFIVAFEKFWWAGCTVTNIAQDKRDRVQLSGRGAGLEVEAFGAIAETLFGGGRMDEYEISRVSNSIKRSFIEAHRAEIPAKEMAKETTRSCW